MYFTEVRMYPVDLKLFDKNNDQLIPRKQIYVVGGAHTILIVIQHLYLINIMIVIFMFMVAFVRLTVLEHII